jgi:hypothetical protein
MTERFTIGRSAELWIVWDTEEHAIIDQDEDIGQMANLAAAMNWLNGNFNRATAN